MIQLCISRKSKYLPKYLNQNFCRNEQDFIHNYKILFRHLENLSLKIWSKLGLTFSFKNLPQKFIKLVGINIILYFTVLFSNLILWTLLPYNMALSIKSQVEHHLPNSPFLPQIIICSLRQFFTFRILSIVKSLHPCWYVFSL